MLCLLFAKKNAVCIDVYNDKLHLRSLLNSFAIKKGLYYSQTIYIRRDCLPNTNSPLIFQTSDMYDQ